MALGQIEPICRKLRREGLPDTTPAALIANGTTREQEILRGTIATLADIALARRPRPPALLIVGEVAGLSERLGRFNFDRATAPDAPGAAKEAGDYVGDYAEDYAQTAHDRSASQFALLTSQME
jgi:hypothetical protein